MSKIDSVKIRMYRHGFGDCFLIRFLDGEKVKFKMLIDCGLKHNDSVEGVSIADVVDDIKKEVVIKKGRKDIPHLDVLVVTHEHWDHVSAFKPEKKQFDSFDIDRIWMAWTENPKDKVAQQINDHLQDSITALGIASARLKKNTSTKKNTGVYKTMFKGSEMLTIRDNFDHALQSMLDFYGPFSATKTTPSGIKIKDNYDISAETQKAFDHIKTKIAKGKSGIKYFKPGSLFEEPDQLPGVRIYVLGPPKDERLNKDSPSAGAKKEVYFGINNANMMGFVKGLKKSAGIDMGFDDGSPFMNVEQTNEKDAKSNTFYKNTYFNSNEKWRTIEDDWLDMAGALALQMDSDTNNTSLVLAIELIDSGKVLLFPGDAQVGNWLSWHDHIWEVTKGTRKEKVTAKDLLEKTVFYKAGHHASHNATLKEQGLELMTDEELVVFIPEKEEQYNGIPFTPLISRLNEQAKGRVLFSADSNFPPDETLNTKPEGITKKDWKQFTDNVEVTDTFIEYRVYGF